MKKHILFFIGFFSLSAIAFAQPPTNRTLFVIDSIPVLTDLEDWNQVLPEDISDISILKNKDSLKLMGWGHLDSITYVFTKEYRKRPDSVKKIPSLKKMVMKSGSWYFQNNPYSGKYIDYYNNGRIQNEGMLSNGKLDGELVVYFKNGNKKSVAYYKDGLAHGVKNEYYKNGALMQTREFINDKETKTGKLYFINGWVQHELKLKKETPYDTSFTYYSTGKVQEMRLIRNGIVISDKKKNVVDYYTPKFYQSINLGDIKEANKSFYNIWIADSTSIDTHFKEGFLLTREFHFDEAIAEFDKALEMEPLMREALVYRGLARLRKNQFAHIKPFPNENRVPPLTIQDIFSVPKDEQEKICSDLLLSDDLDFTDYYVKKIIPETILNYCREKSSRH